MCLATAYIENNGQKEEVLRDVAWVEFEGDSVALMTLMGVKKLVKAKIKRIDLMNGFITFEGKSKVESDDPE
jgi:predicted RNA-binding protein